jgi:hypothetical protein
MEWQSEQFGASHEGRAAAVLADGSEPEPVYFDVGSGSTVHHSSDWWVYDGTAGAPLATGLRAACSCAWRGAARYRVDWDDVNDDGPRFYDTSGPRSDWARHIADTEARSVPLPETLTALLRLLGDQLQDLAEEAPLAALKAVAALERTVDDVAQQAAINVEAEATSWAAVAAALGLTEDDARTQVGGYLLRD